MHAWCSAMSVNVTKFEQQVGSGLMYTISPIRRTNCQQIQKLLKTKVLSNFKNLRYLLVGKLIYSAAEEVKQSTWCVVLLLWFSCCQGGYDTCVIIAGLGARFIHV